MGLLHSRHGRLYMAHKMNRMRWKAYARVRRWEGITSASRLVAEFCGHNTIGGMLDALYLGSPE